MKDFFVKLGAAIKAHKGRTIAIAVTSFLLILAVVAVSVFSSLVFNRFATGILPTDAQLKEAQGQYDRVVIIGVDGCGAYPGEMLDDDEGSLPNFKKLFVDGVTTTSGVQLNGSVTYEGIAVYPTISAQNWTSMFHGVRPPYHEITGESANKDLAKGKQANEKYPSFMKVCLDANPTWKAISSCTWDAVNNGTIEASLDANRMIKKNTDCQALIDIVDGKETIGDADLKAHIEAVTDFESFADPDYALRDAVTVQRIIDATTTEQGKKDYQLVYMHLNQVDSAGHSYGYNKQAYARAVSRVDSLIGKLYAAYDAAGMAEDTLFIFCTDHGHRYLQDGTGHGKNSKVERNVTFAIAGKTVKQGTPGKYVNTDLAPIVCYALGVKAAESWQGRVPYDMFTLLG